MQAPNRPQTVTGHFGVEETGDREAFPSWPAVWTRLFSLHRSYAHSLRP